MFIKTLFVAHSEASMAAQRRVRNMSGQQRDRGVFSVQAVEQIQVATSSLEQMSAIVGVRPNLKHKDSTSSNVLQEVAKSGPSQCPRRRKPSGPTWAMQGWLTFGAAMSRRRQRMARLSR